MKLCEWEKVPSTEQLAPKPRPYSLEKNPYQVGPLWSLIIHYTCPFSFLFPGPGYKRSSSAWTESSSVLTGSALRMSGSDRGRSLSFRSSCPCGPDPRLVYHVMASCIHLRKSMRSSFFFWSIWDNWEGVCKEFYLSLAETIMSGKEILFLTFSFSLFGSQWNFGRVWPHPHGEVFAL